MHNLQNRTLDSLLDSVSVKWRPGEIRPLLSARGSTVKSDSSYSFRFNEMARPAGLEPAAPWFEDIQYKILSAAAGVAYRGTRHLSRSWAGPKMD
jgi:hypothetical protein